MKVEKASDAMSKVETSTYRKKLKKSSEFNIILARASYRAHSRNMDPQFKAISCNSYLKHVTLLSHIHENLNTKLIPLTLPLTWIIFRASYKCIRQSVIWYQSVFVKYCWKLEPHLSYPVHEECVRYTRIMHKNSWKVTYLKINFIQVANQRIE